MSRAIRLCHIHEYFVSRFFGPEIQALMNQHAFDPKDFELLEHQALRRREVEALESMAHTQALLLAGLQTLNKNLEQEYGPEQAGWIGNVLSVQFGITIAGCLISYPKESSH